jgi:hypothetical protein
LDIVLGAHPALESVGELCFLAEAGWINGEYCACGKRGTDCEFWTEVRREWARRVGADDVAAYHALVREIERPNRWKFSLRRQCAWDSERFQTYAFQTRAVFEAIRAVSGKPVVVDSSKLRSRAYALSMIPGIDLRIVHLVRDARGLIWSSKKRLAKDDRAGLPREIRPKATWRMAAGWVVANLHSDWVCRQLDSTRWTTVRYEDLMAEPLSILGQIGQLVGVDLSEVGRALVAGEAIPVGHTVAGNRMRMAGQVRLKPDLEWQSKLAAKDRWLCWAIAGWLMRHYGYARQPDLADEVRKAA